MNHRLILVLTVVSMTGAAANAAAPAQGLKGHELAGQAKITLAQARLIALRAHPGKIADQVCRRKAAAQGFAIHSM